MMGIVVREKNDAEKFSLVVISNELNNFSVHLISVEEIY